MSFDNKDVSQETKPVSNTDPLDKKATQVSFAELVGITQPAVNKHIGRCLQKGQTLRVWLHAYCEQLRNEAAGRSGDDQASLTQARIKECEVKTALNRMDLNEKAGALVPADDAAKAITDWASYAAREFGNAFLALSREIEAAHNLQIDEKVSQAITEPALLRVIAYAETISKKLLQQSDSTESVS